MTEETSCDRRRFLGTAAASIVMGEVALAGSAPAAARRPGQRGTGLAPINPQVMTAETVGGSPSGPSTVAGPDDRRAVPEVDLQTVRNLGVRLARVASALKIVRVTTLHGHEVDAPAYVTRGE